MGRRALALHPPRGTNSACDAGVDSRARAASRTRDPDLRRLRAAETRAQATSSCARAVDDRISRRSAVDAGEPHPHGGRCRRGGSGVVARGARSARRRAASAPLRRGDALRPRSGLLRCDRPGHRAREASRPPRVLHLRRGKVATRIRDALVRKARDGVEVRLLIDGLGSRSLDSTLPRAARGRRGARSRCSIDSRSRAINRSCSTSAATGRSSAWTGRSGSPAA